MNVIALLEEIDPGHFSHREITLDRLREKARELGFFPLPLSRNDIECFWIRLEPIESAEIIHFTTDILFDGYYEHLKKVAKHETR